MKIEFIAFKPSGKYYTTEYVEIPNNELDSYIYPSDIIRTPEVQEYLKNHTDWTILVPSQNPWGHPALIKFNPFYL